MPETPQRSGARRFVADTRPLKTPAFRRLWSASIVTSIGGQLTAVAVPFQIYEITKSSAYVGLSAVFALVPLIVFGLWGGAIADAVDRRKLLLVTTTAIALTSFGFWLQALTELDNIWLIFALLSVQQAFFGINQPTLSASVARLVMRGELPAAIALNTTVMAFGQVMGPLLAGPLIPIIGLPELYLVDSVALTITLWAVFKLPPIPPLHEVTDRAVGIRSVADGFAYLGKQPILLVSFLADVIAMVFGMPRALFPEMAQTSYPGTDSGLALGVLYAAIPIGGVLGGLFSGAFSHVHRHGAAVVVAIIGWGVSVIFFGLSHSLWLGAFWLVVAGIADLVSMVFRSSILQTAATDQMRGRIQGVQTVVVAGGPRIADLLHGTAGSAFGPGRATAAGGVLVIIGVAAMTLLLPKFWQYDGLQPDGHSVTPSS